MSFYNLKELNIKLIDFSTMLSPLGVVKKIVSNGDKHLFEIYFHEPLKIIDGEYEVSKKKNGIKNTPLKIYFEDNLGFIINGTSGIVEISNNINIDNEYFSNIKETDCKNVAKHLRKNIPKDSQNILRNGLRIKGKKITDPDKINIINFDGFHTVNL